LPPYVLIKELYILQILKSRNNLYAVKSVKNYMQVKVRLTSMIVD